MPSPTPSARQPAAPVLAGPPALSRAVVDRSGERRGDEAWLGVRWADPRARVLVVAGDHALVDPHSAELVLVPTGEAPVGERCLLGVDDDEVAYFAVLATEQVAAALLADERARHLRGVGALLSDRDAGLLVHATSLANWHATHPRCARCGEPTTPALAGHVRRCPNCGAEHYPRTDPAVIVLVRDSLDRALLGRQARWPAGRYSTLAGFVEPGESLEHAVAREVFEETGVVVDPTELSYAGSQPWPYPSSLMVGFYGIARTSEIRVDGVELDDARWYHREELRDALVGASVGLPPPASIARRLIEGWFGSGLPDVGWA